MSFGRFSGDNWACVVLLTTIGSAGMIRCWVYYCVWGVWPEFYTYPSFQVCWLQQDSLQILSSSSQRTHSTVEWWWAAEARNGRLVMFSFDSRLDLQTCTFVHIVQSLQVIWGCPWANSNHCWVLFPCSLVCQREPAPVLCRTLRSAYRLVLRASCSCWRMSHRHRRALNIVIHWNYRDFHFFASKILARMTPSRVAAHGCHC